MYRVFQLKALIVIANNVANTRHTAMGDPSFKREFFGNLFLQGIDFFPAEFVDQNDGFLDGTFFY